MLDKAHGVEHTRHMSNNTLTAAQKSEYIDKLGDELAEAKKQFGEIIVRITALHQFTDESNSGWVYALKDAARNAEEEVLAGIERSRNRLAHEIEDAEVYELRSADGTSHFVVD